LHGVSVFLASNFSLAGITRPIVEPITKIGNIMPSKLDYLLARKSGLEANLLNAVNEETAIAIYKMILKVDDQLFNLPK
jgi:hypothetical protein